LQIFFGDTTENLFEMFMRWIWMRREKIMSW
jgi:hypothetical protein